MVLSIIHAWVCISPQVGYTCFNTQLQFTFLASFEGSFIVQMLVNRKSKVAHTHFHLWPYCLWLWPLLWRRPKVIQPRINYLLSSQVIHPQRLPVMLLHRNDRGVDECNRNVISVLRCIQLYRRKTRRPMNRPMCNRNLKHFKRSKSDKHTRAKEIKFFPKNIAPNTNTVK